MKARLWIRIGVLVLIALFMWWLFWAILIDESENAEGIPPTDQREAVE